MLKNPSPTAPLPIKFSLLRVPFLLEPHYDESLPFIESNRERLVSKWGGTAGWERQKHHHDLKGRGLEAGIPRFNLDRLTSNTVASHRLVQYVGKRYGLRVSEGLYDRLNVYYFVEGFALNDWPRLAKVAAEEIGRLVDADGDGDGGSIEAVATEEEILTFLQSDEGRKEIDDAIRTLDDMGVHGIPKFIIEGSTMVDGAARPDVFVQIFREIEARGKVAKGPVFGSILGLHEDVIERGSHSAEMVSA